MAAGLTGQPPSPPLAPAHLAWQTPPPSSQVSQHSIIIHYFMICYFMICGGRGKNYMNESHIYFDPSVHYDCNENLQIRGSQPTAAAPRIPLQPRTRRLTPGFPAPSTPWLLLGEPISIFVLQIVITPPPLKAF